MPRFIDEPDEDELEMMTSWKMTTWKMKMMTTYVTMTRMTLEGAKLNQPPRNY